jgi:hypothetical protein
MMNLRAETLVMRRKVFSFANIVTFLGCLWLRILRHMTITTWCPLLICSLAMPAETSLLPQIQHRFSPSSC